MWCEKIPLSYNKKYIIEHTVHKTSKPTEGKNDRHAVLQYTKFIQNLYTDTESTKKNWCYDLRFQSPLSSYIYHYF